MPNTNIDPKTAVKTLVDLLELNDGELEIEQGGDTENQISYIANLPEAKGIIKYENEEGKLLLIKERH